MSAKRGGPAMFEPLARATTFEAIVEAAKLRRSDLGLPQWMVDEISGLQTGYTGKLEAGIKGLGKVSLPLLLQALKLELWIMPATSPHGGNTNQSDDFFSRRARKARAVQLARQTASRRKKLARAAARARWTDRGDV